MISLFFKEFRSFFSSISGYFIISIFLFSTGFFVWIYPGNSNLFEHHSANLDVLFSIAPWLFLFLIPAICMRLFSEELKSGTIELLVTRPLSELQIVLAKYFASLLLVVMALVPLIFYYLSIYFLGSPVGNIDSGAFMGSFIGLIFLAAVYVSVGVFSSLVSSNQIVSFLLSVLISFFLYLGFDFISELLTNGIDQEFILSLGLDYHYKSISRGVVDSRDLIYFISISLFFLSLSSTVLKSKKY